MLHANDNNNKKVGKNALLVGFIATALYTWA